MVVKLALALVVLVGCNVDWNEGTPPALNGEYDNFWISRLDVACLNGVEYYVSSKRLSPVIDEKTLKYVRCKTRRVERGTRGEFRTGNVLWTCDERSCRGRPAEGGHQFIEGIPPISLG